MKDAATGQAQPTESVSATAEVASAPPAAPQRYTRILLAAFALGLCDQLYTQYSLVDRFQQGYWMTFIAGRGLAPEQYRMGVKMAAWWMVERFGWGFRHGFLAMDVISSLAAVFLLYGLLERRPGFRDAANPARWFASAAFAALLFFYMVWVGSYFRPETLPTTAMTALMLWLWTACEVGPVTSTQRAWLAARVVAVTALQAWVRADVPLALNLGMALAFLLSRPGRPIPGRFWKVAVGVLAAGVAGAIQLYLMRIRYPEATYGPVHVLMIRYGLRRLTTFPPFLCFMVPVAWTVVQFWRVRLQSWRNVADNGLVIASVFYLLLWMVLGKLNEVRIFVPFALAMAPLTVDLALRRIGTLPSGKGVHRVEVHNCIS
jgi:hypothetical protein